VSSLTELSLLSREHDIALDEGRYDDADEIDRQMQEIRRRLRHKRVIADLCEST